MPSLGSRRVCLSCGAPRAREEEWCSGIVKAQRPQGILFRSIFLVCVTYSYRLYFPDRFGIRNRCNVIIPNFAWMDWDHQPDPVPWWSQGPLWSDTISTCNVYNWAPEMKTATINNHQQPSTIINHQQPLLLTWNWPSGAPEMVSCCCCSSDCGDWWPAGEWQQLWRRRACAKNLVSI